jgi:hypothetical protein
MGQLWKNIASKVVKVADSIIELVDMWLCLAVARQCNIVRVGNFSSAGLIVSMGQLVRNISSKVVKVAESMVK